jgi:hypothetical protein
MAIKMQDGTMPKANKINEKVKFPPQSMMI